MKRIIIALVTACALSLSSAPAMAVPSGDSTAVSRMCKHKIVRIASPADAANPTIYLGKSCVIEPRDIDEIASLGFRYRDALGKQHTLHSSARIWAYATTHGKQCKTGNSTGCYTPHSFFTKRHAVVFKSGMTVDTIRFH